MGSVGLAVGPNDRPILATSRMNAPPPNFPAPGPPPPPGGGAPVLVEGYELLEPLGEGGVGCVYRARQLATDRSVAVKVVHFNNFPPSRRDKIETRFRRESLLVLSIDHPNVVRGLDAEVRGDIGHLVMEFVDGPSLQKMIDDAEGAVPVAPCLVVFHQMALALAHLHGRGVIHRDIKPDNIIIGRGGLAKMCDFGLSRSTELLTAEATRLTMPDMPIGTLFTMPPEQVQSGHEADARSDIYALAATLFWALTGRPPFEAKHPFEMFRLLLNEAVPSIGTLRSDLDPGLVALLDGCLARDPDARPQSADLLAAAIGALATGAGLADPIQGRSVLASAAGVAGPSTAHRAAGRRGGPSDEAPPAPPSATASQAASRAPGIPAEVQLIDLILEGPKGTERLGLGAGTVVRIGRDEKADVVVPAIAVSRSHCQIAAGKHGLIVTDLGSSNGTSVNEERVTRALLRDGDVLGLGAGVWFKATVRGGPPASVDCAGCQRPVDVATISAGRVVVPDAFLCRECRNAQQSVRAVVDVETFDLLAELGYTVETRLGGSGVAVTFEVREGMASATGMGFSGTAVARAIRCADRNQAAARAQAAQAALRLRHPHLAALRRVVARQRLLVLFTDRPEGELLTTRLARRGRLAAEEVLRIGLDAARALDYAAKQSVHALEIGPDDLFIDDQGRARVVAPVGGTPARDPESEASGLGVPSFAAPELLAGRETDARTAVYAIAAILFHAFHGEPPFLLAMKRSNEGVDKLVARPTESLRAAVGGKIGSELEKLILLCIAARPQARAVDLSDLVSRLQALVPDPVHSGFDAVSREQPAGLQTQVRRPGRETVRIKRPVSLPAGQDVVAFARELARDARSGLLAIRGEEGGTAKKVYIVEGKVVHVEPDGGRPTFEAAIEAFRTPDPTVRFAEGVPHVPDGAPRIPLGDLLDRV